MKNLIFISGTMGIGKTSTSKQLQKLLNNCVFLDGDWCWDASPFTVNDETKSMVLDNIAHLLSNFLKCSAYENVIFCWVMNQPSTITDILNSICDQYRLHEFSLVCTPEALKKRIEDDIASGIRKVGEFEKSIARLDDYKKLSSIKIDVSELSSKQTADIIFNKIQNR